MNLKLFSLWILLCLSSCISYQKIPLTDCWCKEIRVLAAHSWKYAQLSKNVYNKSFMYRVDDFHELNSYEDTSLSFFAILYENIRTKELVLVFRGTDSPKDFPTGNNPFYQKQNTYALTIFDEIVKTYQPKDITVAGHSLGGGLAINISLNRENVKAYSFNGSPVFKNKLNYKNTRYSIVEYGEVLKLPRVFGREATQEYTSIGCSIGNSVKQHDMKSLADCLTRIAASEDTEALKSLSTNNITLD